MRTRRGFTLLETLIAAVAVTAVLGAGVTANRTVRDGSREARERAQMRALATETVTEFRLVRNALRRQGKTLGDPAGLSLAAGSADAAVAGAWVANQSALPSGCINGACLAAENGGPLLLTWCGFGTACLDRPSGQGGTPVTSPVGIDDQPGASCTGTCTADALLAAVNGLFATAGDVVAVRRTPFTAADLRNRFIADAASPVNAVPATSVLTSQWSDYSFYARRIKVVRLGDCAGGGGGSCALDPLFHLDQSAADTTANRALRRATYRIEVTVSDLANPATTVRSAAFLTDW